MRLSLSEADRHYPLRLRGIITCFFQRDNLCFFQDDTMGIYLYDSQLNPSIRQGCEVEVSGSTGAGLYSPIVLVTNLTLGGIKPLPPAKPVSLDRLASGNEDGQWVEIEGIVRNEQEEWSYWLMEIVAGNSRLQARIVNYQQASKPPFIGAMVRVRGVAAAKFNSRNQLVGFQLLVPTLSDLTIVETPVRDPFLLPLQPAAEVMAHSSQGFGHRTRVQGVVTMHRRGEAVFIRDRSGSLMILTRQNTPLSPGEVIEVAGFPAYGGYSPVLQDAVYRKSSAGPPPLPIRITPPQAGSGKFDHELVQLSGTLIRQEWSQSNRISLVLRSGTNNFRAFLPVANAESPPEVAPLNSLLRVTGICAVEAGADRNPIGWQLDLRSTRDVELLRSPAQWQLGRLGWAVGFAGLATAIGLVWLVTLRYKVRQETAALHMQERALEERYRDLLESANDIIYTLDPLGYFTSWNQAGERLTGYSRAEIRQMKLENLVTSEHRDAVQYAVARTLAGEIVPAFDVEFVSKRHKSIFMDTSFRLVRKEGKPAGLRGIARDISTRKQAEEVVRQSEKQLRRFLAERERLGRDLHDGIIQSIYGVGLGLEDCRQLLPANVARVGEHLQKTIQDLNRIIRDVRHFIQGLEPDALQAQNLAAALQSMVLSYEESNAIRIYLDLDPETTKNLQSRQASHVFFLTREAVSNSVRHAKARQIRINSRSLKGIVHLEITDDGEGFNPQLVIDKGLGLRNMAARARDLGGQISVFSEPGAGTRVLVEFPIETPYDSK